MSQPETGALSPSTRCTAARTGRSATLRRTGHEDDREVHLALNSGIPLVDPTGGFFFVFQTGEPVFRKYDAAGQLLFERHIAGARDRRVRRRPADHVAAAADRAKASCRSCGRRSAPPRSIAPATSGSRSSCPTPTSTIATATSPHGPVPRRRHHRAEQPVLRQERPPARDARALRVRVGRPGCSSASWQTTGLRAPGRPAR